MPGPFPLLWPEGHPRKTVRKDSAFGKRVPGVGNSTDKKSLSIADALKRLQAEIDRLKATDVMLSSNLVPRLDGAPRADQGNPSDPGVCLYFTLNGKPHALPCDTYRRAADNIAAIAAHIEATRAIERYGVATVEDMFRGFAQLPPPTKGWRQVMAFGDGIVTQDAIEARYRVLARDRHPDVPGGSHEKMAELNEARMAALRETRF
jgi:hypothetical protein